MMRPFFQGTVDTFCAAYAVLNALQITHGIKAYQGRELLTKLLLALSKDEIIFTRILCLKTDYIAMTDAFMDCCVKDYPLKITKPFQDRNPSMDEFWQEMKEQLDAEAHKTAIFQFEKRIATSDSPLFAHWSTAWEIRDDEFRLFDSSPELNAMNVLYRNKCSFDILKDIDGEYARINVKSVRFIEKLA